MGLHAPLACLLTAIVAQAVDVHYAGLRHTGTRLGQNLSSRVSPSKELVGKVHGDAKAELYSLRCGVSLYVCTNGDGKTFPKAGDTLQIHYVGRLAKNDIVFGSKSMTVGIGKMLEGLNEGLMKMSLGEHSIVNIPATKRHSTKDPSDDQPLAIPPNEDVYFEIRLLAINGNQAETPDEGLPEQGYSGKKVKHEEGKTCVEDWRREYGPKMGEKGPCGGGDDDNEPKKEPKKLEKKKEDEHKPKERSGTNRSHHFSWFGIAVAIILAHCCT